MADSEGMCSIDEQFLNDAKEAQLSSTTMDVGFPEIEGEFVALSDATTPICDDAGTSRNSVLLIAACEHRLGRHHPAARTHPESCTGTTA